MERHERANQARASMCNADTVAHDTSYTLSNNAHHQAAPAHKSSGVPFAYARFQSPLQRQATMRSCCSEPHPADMCRLLQATCYYCLQESHVQRACWLKQRARSFVDPVKQLSQRTVVTFALLRTARPTRRGGRNCQNARGRRSGRGGPRYHFVSNPISAYLPPLEVPIQADSQTVTFVLDTGTTVSLMVWSTFERLRPVRSTQPLWDSVFFYGMVVSCAL